MTSTFSELIEQLKLACEGKPIPTGAWRKWKRGVMRKTEQGWRAAPKRKPMTPEEIKSKPKAHAALAIVTRDDGHLLMLQRHHREPWMPTKWNLPGGMVDKGETPHDAAKREAHEEAGVRVGPLKKVGSFHTDDGEVLHVFHAKQHEGKPAINHESSDLQWVHHSKAHKMDVVPVLKPILKHFSEVHGSKLGAGKPAKR